MKMSLRKTATDAIETTKKSINASLIIAAIGMLISAVALIVALAS